MNWILINDTLPDEHKHVLISNGKEIGSASLAFYADKTQFYWRGEGFSGYEWEWDFEPTHWAELPELPK